MGPGHFSDDFKRDAVAQITERGYHYYVSQALLQGHKVEAGSLPRVAANAIEQVVIERLPAVVAAKAKADADTLLGQEPSPCDHDLIAGLLDHAIVSRGSITPRLAVGALQAEHPEPITVP